MILQLPLTQAQLQALRIGERYELCGEIYTARDEAHKRMIAAVERGEALPIPIAYSSIFYTGPCPPRPGMAIGSIGATTSSRMDPYVETMLRAGNRIMIGKGTRAPYIAELCKRYNAVYFMVFGGIAALYSKAVTEAEIVAYEDLGTEAIRRLRVNGFQVIVATDTLGNVLQDVCQKEFQEV